MVVKNACKRMMSLILGVVMMLGVAHVTALADDPNAEIKLREDGTVYELSVKNYSGSSENGLS